MLLGISGKIGSGKDTLADEVVFYDSNRIEKRAFATKLKQITAILTGEKYEDMFTQEGKNIYLEDWKMTVGEFQQKMGTEGMRYGVHPEGWILALFSDYQFSSDWIISDLRFVNEAQAIKDRGGFLIRLNGDPAKIRENSTRDLTHPSETGLDDWTDWDMIIENTPPMINLLNDALGVYNKFFSLHERF